MSDNVCGVCGHTISGKRVIWAICSGCEPRSEFVDGKWRLRQQPQTIYKLDFLVYVRWLTGQPKGSIVGDAGISDQCPVHNWLASMGIGAYVYYDSIVGVDTPECQDLPELFGAVQHEMCHELDLDLEDKEDGLITRETALMCAYRVIINGGYVMPKGVTI